MKVTATLVMLVIILILFALFVTPIAPASAQDVVREAPTETATPERDDGSLYSGAYVATEDGSLIYGGDVVYQCEDLVRLGAPAKSGSREPSINGTVLEPLTREAVELCAEAGFPPAGATINVPALSDASATTDTPETERDTTLPATGGILPVLFLTVAVLIVVCVFLVLPIRH
ncbi:MAG: hypothetical protein WA982_16765 [Rubrobacteraceae bacterium]